MIPKIGPNAAFDLSRDTQLKAIESLLVAKDIATQSEIDAEKEKLLGESAKNISNMPPLRKEGGNE